MLLSRLIRTLWDILTGSKRWRCCGAELPRSPGAGRTRRPCRRGVVHSVGANQRSRSDACGSGLANQVLVGANGAGKTTLLRCISGVQPVMAGSISPEGAVVTSARPEARVKAGICQSPEGRQMFGPMSVEDNLRTGGFTRRASDVEAGLQEAYTLFLVLQEKRALPAGTLSGGQQQMLRSAGP